MLSIRRDHYRKKVREIEKRIASLSSEIKGLEGFIRSSSRKETPPPKHSLRKEIPESKRRLVSYLSTGSFQTMDLRRHEKRAAKIRRVVIIAVIIMLILLIWIWFRG